MIEGKIVRFLETANQRKWADEDLIHDLEFLTETISEVIGEMRLVFYCIYLYHFWFSYFLLF